MNSHRVWTLLFGLFIGVSLLDIDLCLGQSSDKPELVIRELSPKILTLNRKELIRLAKAYSMTKNHVSAIGAYNAVLTKNSRDFQAKTLIGNELSLMGKSTEAIAVYKEAIEINPKYEPAYLGSAEIYEKKQNPYELRLIYQDLVARVGERPQYLTKLCGLSLAEGLYDLSFKYCRRAIQKNPKDPSSHVNLGLSYKETGQSETAEKYLKQAANSFASSSLAQIAYANILREQKNFPLAYAYYERAAKVDPKSTQALIGIGFSGIELDKYQESLSAFKQACRLDKATTSDMKKALSLVRLRKTAQWASQFERASDLCGISN